MRTETQPLLRTHNNSFRPKLGQKILPRLNPTACDAQIQTDALRTFPAMQVSLCTCTEGSVLVIFKGCVQLLNTHLGDYACAL